MTLRSVRFKQVDVFTSRPFKGNPLAVVFDADGLDPAQMQAIARWTNLSETAFLLAPTDTRADYRVRIFTTQGELPFAGHPTLGTAHAFLDSGRQPKTPGHLVQECGAGLVELAGRHSAERHSVGRRSAGRHSVGRHSAGPHSDERAGDTMDTWAFAAPPAKMTPLPESQYDALRAALRSDAIDFSAAPCGVDNGAPWLVVRLSSAQAVLALDIDYDALASIAASVGAQGLAAYGAHDANGPATFEVRCLMTGLGIGEDPVTGSANAAIAMLLAQQNRRPGSRYTVRQGTTMGRDGRVLVDYDDAAGKIWIGGTSLTVVDGTIELE
ncbi:PhzF family phenazine biosynthesis protein [Paraburkholderia silviterrae]|uniref:PhzF family phenazine biosynthesis protein n=1 Tax=Paraburkholderia silviterrae TaxID=2528715 RepID=A0A4R5M4G3_9BURK|nr:PhzF family phenazine biosynthesis protein [Paraburkholderia silviterrae]TDG20712.1 PhzF family phenazine biosynthesis protein [Paraburkholderia silviterrae]